MGDMESANIGEISKNGNSSEDIREKIEKKRNAGRPKNKIKGVDLKNGTETDRAGSETGNRSTDFEGAIDFEQEQTNRTEKRDKPKGAGKFKQSRAGRKKKVNNDVINALGLSIYAFHSLIAGALKTPELAISSEQSESLSKALAGLDEVYDIVIPAKTIALGNFLITAISIYAPITISIIQRKKQEKNKNIVDYDKVSG